MAVYYYTTQYDDYLMHYGIKNQKWGVRRFQNEDGSLTPAGIKRYRVDQSNGAIGNRKKYAKDVGKSLNKLDKDFADKFGESMFRKDKADKLKKKYDSYVDKRKQKLGIGENDTYVDASKKGMKKASKYNKAAEKYNNLRSGMSENESNTWKTLAGAEEKGFDVTKKDVIRTSKAGRASVSSANTNGYLIAGPIGGAIAGMSRKDSLDRKYGPRYGGQSPVTIYGNKYKAYDRGIGQNNSTNNEKSYKGPTYEQASKMRSTALKDLNSVEKRYKEGKATELEYERAVERWSEAETEYENAKKRR